jgi:hypothetical protein
MSMGFEDFGIMPRPAVVRSVNYFEEQRQEAFCRFLDEEEAEERRSLIELDGGNGYIADIQYMDDEDTERFVKRQEEWTPDFRSKLRTQND